MKKSLKTILIITGILLAVAIGAVVLLFICESDKTYIEYDTAIEKLESAGYTVSNITADQEIDDKILDIANAYNTYAIQKNAEDVAMGYAEAWEIFSLEDIADINIDRLIFADKGDLHAYIFYCGDESSAETVSSWTSPITNTYFAIDGPMYGGMEGDFVYLYSEVVDEILGLAS